MVIKESKTGQIYNINTPSKEVGNAKLVCPVCSKSHAPGKQANRDLSWSLDKKVGNCHRCGSSFYKHTLRSEIKKACVKPLWKNSTELDDRIIKYFENRKISQATIRWNDLVSSGMEFIAGKESMTIQFNYWRNSELINIKYRDSAKNFKMVKDAELIFYNLDSLKGQTSAKITEGEADCLSLLEVGFKAVVSVPNGAGASLDFMENCIDEFTGIEKIILATDQDEAGYKLRDELARRFGIERCYKVDFADCKDANEYLIKYGAEKLRNVIEIAEPFPFEGVFTSLDIKEELESLYLNGLQRGEIIGFSEFDELLTWQAGRVYTVTGIPGHGKSEFVDFVLTRLNIFKKWKIGYFSPENWPIELHACKIIEKITGKKCSSEFMSKSEFDEAAKYMADNFYFILPEDDFTVETILAKASGLVERKGINVLVIDPYNRLEHKIPVGISETHYISSFYDKISTFAKRKNVMIILVAHPTKMKRENGKYEIPNLYDISGSANFYNKTDFGLTVYRDFINSEISVFIQKIKFRHLGTIGVAKFRYNTTNGRFSPLIFDVTPPGKEICEFDNSNYLQSNKDIILEGF
jgi:twinkle protein